jgi:hypothetical protein
MFIDEEPSKQCMRCVPAVWVVPSQRSPVKVWDDTGAGGGRPGSIWTINTMNMIAVVPGHDAPKETFYDLSDTRFLIESNFMK